nr:jasmonate ZIM domain protein 1 [Gastrodia elata]
MSLLPGIDVSVGDDFAGAKGDALPQKAPKSIDLFPCNPPDAAPSAKQPEMSQLTIFYGGRVLVFDNFPAEKAEDLMQLASKESAPAADRPPNSPVIFPSRPQPSFSDLPIARKASLHRFLEKRKDRITAKAPYQASSGEEGFKKAAFSVKQEEICQQPWLGLGTRISNCSR